MTRKINVKVIFLNEERNVTILEENLLEDFEGFLESTSESRRVNFNYYCALTKLFEEGEIEIKLKFKKEKYIHDLDKKHEERKEKERLEVERKKNKEFNYDIAIKELFEEQEGNK